MTSRSPSGKPVPRSNGTSPGAAAARGFLETYGPLFGIDDEASMDVASTRPAAEGRRTVKFRKTHKGIPVIAGELNVGLDAKGNVLYASGEAVDTASVDVSPAVPAAAAVRTRGLRRSRRTGCLPDR